MLSVRTDKMAGQNESHAKYSSLSFTSRIFHIEVRQSILKSSDIERLSFNINICLHLTKL